MKLIKNQLNIVADLYKISLKQLLTKDGSFIIPSDWAGAWTTGFIADMGGKTLELAGAEAKLLDMRNKIQRYVTDPEKGPKLDSIISKENAEPVTDVMTDFCLEDTVKLISETQFAWVKGYYLAHFITNYPDCEFKIEAELKAVKVINKDELIGLIMPIRIAE